MSAVLTLFILSALVTAEGADDEAFFEAFAEKRTEVRTLEANFTQDNIAPGDVYRSMGKVYYAKPRRLVFRYYEPELVYVIDGSKVYEYDAELEQLQVFDMSHSGEAEALFLGFEDNLARLREAYEVTLFDPLEVDAAAKGVELMRKLSPEAAEEDTPGSFFEQVRLYLRKGDFLPLEVHVRNTSDSSVVMRISDHEVNKVTDPRKFQVFLPEGTVVIEDERVVETVGPEGAWTPEPVQPLEPAESEGTQEDAAP